MGADGPSAAVRVLQSEFDDPGVAGQIGRTREWSFTPRSGTGYTSVTRVSVEPAAGGTRLTISRSIRGSVREYMRGGSFEVLVSLVLLAVSLLVGETLVLGGVSLAFLAAVFMAIELVLVGGAQIGARVWARRREAQFDRVLGCLDLVARSSEATSGTSGEVTTRGPSRRFWISTLSLTTGRTRPARRVTFERPGTMADRTSSRESIPSNGLARHATVTER